MSTITDSIDWRALVAKMPAFHASPLGELFSFPLPDDVLDYIAGLTNERTCSLETGLGASTIVFTAQQSRHFCITPAADEIERITDFFHANGVDCDHVTFEPDYSEFALPRMDLPQLDVVLIDGRHGFPAPMLDWYYTGKYLKVGGALIVDDVDLWPVQQLIEYLSSSPSWSVDRIFSRTIAYRRLAAGDERAEWTDQANVVTKTAACREMLRRKRQVETARQLVSSGRFDLLLGKALRKALRTVFPAS
jgi:hypothetical protein